MFNKNIPGLVFRTLQYFFILYLSSLRNYMKLNKKNQIQMKYFEHKTFSDLLILVLALISISVHLLVINNLEYHRDELLYTVYLCENPVISFNQMWSDRLKRLE